MLTAMATLALLVAAQDTALSAAPPHRTVGAHEGELVHVAFLDKGKTLLASTDAGEVGKWKVKGSALAAWSFTDGLDAAVVGEKGRRWVGVQGSLVIGLELSKLRQRGMAGNAPDRYHALAWIPKWRWAFAGLDRGVLKRFQGDDVSGGADTLGTGQDSALLALATSGAGHRLACGTEDGKLILVEPRDLDVLAVFEAHGGPVRALAFAAGDEVLVSAGDEGLVRFHDVEQKRELAALQGHASAVLALAVDPKGAWIASGDEQGVIILWNAETRERAHTLAAGRPVRALAFGPKGRALAGPGPDGGIALWELAELE